MLQNSRIIIDSGYYFFYRFHATKIWFKKSHQIDENDDITENDDFVNMFKKKTASTIIDLSKKFKCPVKDIIFACDGARSNLWRTNSEHVEDYKGTRKNVAGIGKMIKIGYETLRNMDISPRFISCHDAEADDIIAVLSRKINKENPDFEIKIITSDKDLEQLCNDNICLHSLKNKFPKSILKFDPKISLMIKIIGGDKSDNILPIANRLGKNKILSLAQSEEKLQEFLSNSSDEIKSRFESNKKIIDLSLIPDDIQSRIIEKYESN